MNDVLCWLEDLLAEIIGWINDTFGEWFGFELDVPDVGCDD